VSTPNPHTDLDLIIHVKGVDDNIVVSVNLPGGGEFLTSGKWSTLVRCLGELAIEIEHDNYKLLREGPSGRWGGKAFPFNHDECAQAGNCHNGCDEKCAEPYDGPTHPEQNGEKTK